LHLNPRYRSILGSSWPVFGAQSRGLKHLDFRPPLRRGDRRRRLRRRTTKRLIYLHVCVKCAGVIVRAFVSRNLTPRRSCRDGAGIENSLSRITICCGVGLDVVVLPLHGVPRMNAHGFRVKLEGADHTVTVCGETHFEFAGQPALACDLSPVATYRPIWVCFVSVGTLRVALKSLICSLLFSKYSARFPG